MSDYEDDMDVDAPVAQDAVTFSSDNTNSKGKRSAANLPVEAEDSLPWCVSQLVLVEMVLTMQ
jgi:replication factor C subunit 3/5